MTDETTPVPKTPEEIAAEAEQEKIANQDAAFKRLQEKNKKLEEELKAKDVETVVTPVIPEETPEQLEVRRIAEEAALKALDAKDKANGELSSVLTKYPDLKKHEGKIKEFLQKNRGEEKSVDEIVAGSVGVQELMMLGAKIGSDQLQAVAESQTGGGDAIIETKTEMQKTEDYYSSIPPK